MTDSVNIGGPSAGLRCTPAVPPLRLRGSVTAGPPPIAVAEHPLLEIAAFVTTFPAPLEGVRGGAGVETLLRGGEAPLQLDETLRSAVRDMLRWGGYKPTGRGKPASEYLLRAAGEEGLDSINPAVDVANAVSLHSGFPISVVDVDRLAPPLLIRLAEEGARYVFNAAGQEIALEGLICLLDSAGPCANAVRDSHRTKTTPRTRATLSLIWGVVGHEARLNRAERWYRALLEEAGARTEPVVFAGGEIL